MMGGYLNNAFSFNELLRSLAATGKLLGSWRTKIWTVVRGLGVVENSQVEYIDDEVMEERADVVIPESGKDSGYVWLRRGEIFQGLRREIVARLTGKETLHFQFENALFFIDERTGKLAVVDNGTIPGSVRQIGGLNYPPITKPKFVSKDSYLEINYTRYEVQVRDSQIVLIPEKETQMKDGRVALKFEEGESGALLEGFEAEVLHHDSRGESSAQIDLPQIKGFRPLSYYVKNIFNPEPLYLVFYDNTTDRNGSDYLESLFKDDYSNVTEALKKANENYEEYDAWVPDSLSRDREMQLLTPGEEVREAVVESGDQIFGGLEDFFAEGRVVLDLGTGEGIGIREISRYFFPESVLVGVDVGYDRQVKPNLNKKGVQFSKEDWDVLATIPDNSVDSLMSVAGAFLHGKAAPVVQAVTRVAKEGTVLRVDQIGVADRHGLYVDELVKNGWTVYHNGSESRSPSNIVAKYTHPNGLSMETEIEEDAQIVGIKQLDFAEADLVISNQVDLELEVAPDSIKVQVEGGMERLVIEVPQKDDAWTEEDFGELVEAELERQNIEAQAGQIYVDWLDYDRNPQETVINFEMEQ